MKLSAPKQGTFVISVLLLIAALIIKFAGAAMPSALSNNVLWIAVASQVVLMIGCAIKGF